MSKFHKYWAKQFGNPKGLGGKIATMIMNVINKQQYRAVESFLSKTDNGKVLDVGFGNGYLIKKLAKKYPAAYYGIDLSEKSIRNVQTAVGVAESIPFDTKFDLIYTVNTVYFWQDIEKGLQEIKSKLADNGKFVNVIYSKQWLDKLAYTQYGFTKYSAQDLAECTKQVDLNVEVIPIQKDKSYAIVATK
jgi:SAM-dependent methyltransferase